MTDLPVRFAAILLLLAGVVNPAQALPPAPVTGAPATGIRVQVYGIHYGGNIVYSYKVTNNSDASFNNFTIGSYFDSEEDGELPQLTRLPLGWRYGEEGETGPEIILTESSFRQPPNWTSQVFGQQDTGNYYLEWNTPWGDNNISNVISPGQSLAGFSVTVPLVDGKLSLPVVTRSARFHWPRRNVCQGRIQGGIWFREKVPAGLGNTRTCRHYTACPINKPEPRYALAA